MRLRAAKYFRKSWNLSAVALFSWVDICRTSRPEEKANNKTRFTKAINNNNNHPKGFGKLSNIVWRIFSAKWVPPYPLSWDWSPLIPVPEEWDWISVPEIWDFNNTLPIGGVYWKIRPLRQFSPRGPKDLRAEGRKLPRGAYFPIHPDLRQCIAILFSRARVYWI